MAKKSKEERQLLRRLTSLLSELEVDGGEIFGLALGGDNFYHRRLEGTNIAVSTAQVSALERREWICQTGEYTPGGAREFGITDDGMEVLDEWRSNGSK